VYLILHLHQRLLVQAVKRLINPTAFNQRKKMKNLIAFTLISLTSMLSLNLSFAAGDSMEKEEQSPVGNPVASAKKFRVINIVMNDQLRFQPDKIEVKNGETIKFVVKNAGKIKHEIVIGSAEKLKAHAEMMKSMPGMVHKDADQLTLAPGKSGKMTWKFIGPGTLEFACFEPGHSEAGMNGVLTVK
jgi:uncharacterized cupredoxin-like copper-binding protein